ncbi:LYR motif-containing protein [Phanerochaete sordida]|uniref:LYR motif-containing protein n=1 Tax=Phanerochaete sordida TaxID=48140 RepID=A0A9P3L724_9APHY|nr:LYR motif-containing protein [Phanerochaete sordida]
MSSPSLQAYRRVVREINRAAIAPRATRNPVVASSFRKLYEQNRDNESFAHDMQNALTFMHSQRMHKVLLDRYNPLHDLSPEERIKATARRVGLDMPVNSSDDKDN